MAVNEAAPPDPDLFKGMSDEELGKAVRKLAHYLQQYPHRHPERNIKSDLAAGMLLIDRLRRLNAGSLRARIIGHTVGGVEVGDFQITVRQRRKHEVWEE